MQGFVEALQITSGCVSILACIVGLLPLYSSEKLRRDHFTQIAFYTIFCWMLVSIAMTFGFPANGSTACQLQSFILLFFTPAAGGWMAALFFQYYSLAVFGKTFLGMPSIHFGSWLLGSLPAFFPLVKLEYGRPSIFPFSNGSGVCTFTAATDTEYLQWFLSLLLVEAPLLLLFYFFVGASMVRKFGSIGGPIQAVLVWAVLLSFMWIPIGIVGAIWISGSLEDNTINRDAFHLAYAWTAQSSTCVAIVGIQHSAEVRRAWRALLIGESLDDALVKSDSVLEFTDTEATNSHQTRASGQQPTVNTVTCQQQRRREEC